MAASYNKHVGVVGYDRGVDSEKLVLHLADGLRNASAYDVQIQGTLITFRGGVLRLVSNWNVLGPFGSGEIEVDPKLRIMRFRLNFTELLIAATVLVILVSVSLLASHNTKMLAAVPLIWVFLVGVNLLTGIPRFNVFIRKLAQNAPKYARERVLSGGRDGC